MHHALPALCLATLTNPVFAAPNVVTDLPPIHSLVAIVMGDIGAPQLLVSNGSDPHDFQLRPSQAAGLVEADLVIWIGPQMTPWLDRALTGVEAKAQRLTLMETPKTELQAFGDGHDHDHEGHSDQAEAHGNIDPHLWLDPHNAANWLPLIAVELGKLDPENAARYKVNAELGQAEITALETEIAGLLAPVQTLPFVTYHDAYGYFTGHFGLTYAGSVRLGDAATPGAAHLSELRDELTAGGVVCLFPEVNHDAGQAAQLVEGTKTKLGAALDPAGVTLPVGPALYANLMRGLAQNLQECLTPR
jgi:zinc transport system substrate-binding protein